MSGLERKRQVAGWVMFIPSSLFFIASLVFLYPLIVESGRR
jgi:hypothetical protein